VEVITKLKRGLLFWTTRYVCHWCQSRRGWAGTQCMAGSCSFSDRHCEFSTEKIMVLKILIFPKWAFLAAIFAFLDLAFPTRWRFSDSPKFCGGGSAWPRHPWRHWLMLSKGCFTWSAFCWMFLVISGRDQMVDC